MQALLWQCKLCPRQSTPLTMERRQNGIEGKTFSSTDPIFWSRGARHIKIIQERELSEEDLRSRAQEVMTNLLLDAVVEFVRDDLIAMILSANHVDATTRKCVPCQELRARTGPLVIIYLSNAEVVTTHTSNATDANMLPRADWCFWVRSRRKHTSPICFKGQGKKQPDASHNERLEKCLIDVRTCCRFRFQ